MPVVPGKNTDLENITATAAFLEGLGVRELTLLRYNHLWEAKLSRLARGGEPLGILPPEPDFYRGLELRFAARGIAVHL
jgi:pyruvate-formate lyase-activating enzyme